jgi:hypothetical protein
MTLIVARVRSCTNSAFRALEGRPAAPTNAAAQFERKFPLRGSAFSCRPCSEGKRRPLQ